ncbi:4-hydroxybenzoate polyprenyltransferase [Halarchaeum rubridurum]|uniref:4-hydroxybenzoate polyprenyltransferase n=1 Tax=Halarchaeum rubridurum TaxID=489911 RepID=A0A830G047_9EURY|nr:UbiA family prenyltransferase [Halarchaeum rubridurum]MBP1955118.1 4-hydroxybenzoate polyprenyltransferase [Halarchaeum rubridurum]GGM68802.1 hypothetical protein GCM10009017_18760 [Halarchaeum rubridurum]
MSSQTDSPSLAWGGTRTVYSTLAALSEYGTRAKDALVYSSAYLVVIAAVEVVTAMVALSLPPSPAPLVIALLTFAVYVGDRIADAAEDAATSPERAAFVTRHRRLFSLGTAAAYGLAVALAVLGGPLALAVTLLPGAFWILYASDWLPSLSRYASRLKDVLVVNSAVVALAWAVCVVCLPLAYADGAFTPTAAVVFGYFFLDTYVNTEIPNLRDREGDAANGVATLPVVLGVRRTRHVLYALDLVLVAGIALAFGAGILGVAMTAGVLVGLGYALCLAWFVGRTERYGRLAIAGEAKHLLVVAVVVALGAAGF